MPTFNSIRLISELEQQTEHFLNEAIQQWQMLPPRVMQHREAPGKWSAAQCLAHLNSYGNYYLPAIEKSIVEAKTIQQVCPQQFKTSWIGNWFTQLMLPKKDTGKITKMKAPKDHSPVENINSDAAIATFISQQEKMLQLLEEGRKVNLRKTKTPISISQYIKLPLGDTFRFLIAHNYRHVLQARRAIQHAQAELEMV